MIKKVLISVVMIITLLCACEGGAPSDASSGKYPSSKDVASVSEQDSSTVYIDGPIKLRAMTYNVKAERISGDPVADRIDGVLQVLSIVQPDVFATQEADDMWRYFLTHEKVGVATLGYEYKYAEINDYKENLQRIGVGYKKDKYTFIKDGLKYFDDYVGTYYEPEPPSYFGVYWVMLRDNETGKEFIFASTHWHHNSGKTITWANAARHYQAVETVELLKELEEKYGCPIILSGDFNTKTLNGERMLEELIGSAANQSDSYGSVEHCMQPIETQTNYRSASECEGVELTEGIKSNQMFLIDHIFVDKTRVKPTYCDMFFYNEYNFSDKPSDHYPVLADLVIE